jgi:gliding motility-associated-like protein
MFFGALLFYLCREKCEVGLGKSPISRIFLLLITLLPVISSLGMVQSVVPASSCGSCDGQIIIAAPGTWSGILFSITGEQVAEAGETASLIAGLCPGLYQLLIISQGAAEESIIVSVGIEGLSAGTPSAANLCVGGNAVSLFSLLNGNPSVGGTWSDLSGNPVGHNFSPSVPGIFSFLYSLDAGNCLVQNQLTVSVNANANPGISTTYLICDHYAPFAMVDALFGQPDLGGLWFNSNFQPISGVYDPAIDQTGVFTYMINEVPGCMPVFSTLFVIENPYPDSGEDTEILVCPNALPFDMTDMLGGNPNPGGQWYYNMVQPVSSIFNPATSPPGQYRYQVNGATPCPNVWSFLTIDFTDGIDAGEDGAVAFCFNGSSVLLDEVLTGQPDAGGVWVNSSGGSVGNIFIPDTPGEFVFTYEVNAVGCQPVSANAHISVVASPVAGLFEDSQLCGESFSLNLSDFLIGSDDGGFWLNQSGEVISEDVIVLAGQPEQFRYVVVSDVCPPDTSFGFIQVIQPPPQLGSAQLGICLSTENFSLFEWSQNLPQSGTWLSGNTAVQADDFVVVFGQSELKYVVPSGTICPADTFVLLINAYLSSFESEVIFVSVCELVGLIDLTESLSAEVLASGTWLGDNSVVSAIPGEHFILFQEMVQIESACQSSVIEFEIHVDAMPDAGPNATHQHCANESDLVLSSLLNTSWTDGIWMWNGSPAPAVIPMSNLSNQMLEYVIPANGECPGTSAFHSFDIDFGISFNPGTDLEVCPDFEPVQLGDIPQTGYSYLWFPELRLDNPNSAQPFISLENPENTEVNIEYTVVVSNGVCTFNETIEVVIHPFPLASAGADILVCYGQNVVLHASGGPIVEWEFPGVSNPATNPQVLVADEDFIANVLVTSAFGCASVDSVKVEVLPSPDVFFDVFPYEGCSPLETTVTNLSENEPATSYQWFVNGTLVSLDFDFDIFLDGPGSYDFMLLATASNGCANSLIQEDMVMVFGQPEAFFSSTPDSPNFLQPEMAFFNQSTGASGYEWTLDGQSVSFGVSLVHEFPDFEDRSYIVCLRAVNDFGCESNYCEEILIQGLPAVYVPNAFTPDGDGMNDFLIPVMTGMSEETYEFRIYNRWGQKIFSTNRPDEPWIGNAFEGNHYVEPDVYQWMLFCQEAKTGVRKEFRGHVTVIR